MDIRLLRIDCALKQKKGLHFILASIILWTAITILHYLDLPILTKNLYTFYLTAPLVPLAFLVSKVIKVNFQNKDNPLNNLGVIFSINQMLYLLIAMWVFPTVPDKMLMVIAIIFGAHLLPYGWLYISKTYYFFSLLIPLLALFIGINFSPYLLGIAMIIVEVIFSFSLMIEVVLLKKQVSKAMI